MENIFETLQRHARERGTDTALIHGRTASDYRRISFTELVQRAAHFAHVFKTHAPNDAICPLYLSKSPDCVAAMFGALGAGKAFACLNRKLRPPQVNAVIHDTQATLAIMDGPGIASLRKAFDQDEPVSRIRWFILKNEDYLPFHDKLVCKIGGEAKLEFLPEAEDAAAALSRITPNAGSDPMGCCLFTSGSTGTPKGVCIAEPDLQERAHAEIELFNLTSSDVLLSILPFSFDVGLNQILSGILAGCSVVLMDSWLPADILQAVAEFKVTGISGVPTIWLDMLNGGMAFETDEQHASLRYITVSGGDLAPEHLNRMPELAPGVEIFKTYGQTETFRSTALRPKDFATKQMSVGRPFGSARVYVLRADGTPCAPNEIGEVVHTGLGTMQGYLRDTNSSGKLRDNPFHGDCDAASLAVFTGDMAHLDEDGYLFLKGREDTMVKISGNRVYPEEVVSQLAALDGVQQAEVIPVEIAPGDKRLCAFVVLDADGDANPKKLQRTLGTLLPTYMVPQEVVVLSAMPRTATGKNDKPALLAQARKLMRVPTP